MEAPILRDRKSQNTDDARMPVGRSCNGTGDGKIVG